MIVRLSIILASLLCAPLAHALQLTTDNGPRTKPTTQPATKPAGLPIAPIHRTTPIDFEKEILPILSTNCMACHNKTKAKANLILETPPDMLKGGDTGPAVIPRKSGESLLLLAASHKGELVMPPKDNKVAAVDLNPQQLGLIKLWIDQGATGSVTASAEVKWQPLKETFAPIYAVALTQDGQYAAFGRGNQLVIYHVPTRQIAARLIDPSVTATGRNLAHLDLVRSLSFSPDGNLLASGAYREVKLWKRPQSVQKFSIASTEPIRALAASPDGKLLATAADTGTIQIADAATGQKIKDLTGHTAAITSLHFSADSARLASASAAGEKTIRVFDIASAKQLAQASVPEISVVRWISATQLATAAARRLVIWKLPEGAATELTIAKELPSQESAIKSMDATATAPSQILVGCEDGSIRLWNVDSAQATAQMKHDAPITSLAIRADGKRLASAGATHARLWDEKGKQLAEIKGAPQLKDAIAKAERHLAFATSEVAYHKNFVTAADKDAKAQADRLKKATDADTAAKKTLDEKKKAVATATEAKNKAETEKQPADKLAAATKAVTDAQAAATAAEKPASLAATELELSTRISQRSSEALTKAQAALASAEAAHKSAEAAVPAAKKSHADSAAPIRALAFSPDGQTFALATDDKSIHTFSSEAATHFDSFTAPAPATSLAFTSTSLISSADKSTIAFTLRPDWLLDKKLPLPNQPPLTDCINALDFSADGTLLAAGGGIPTRGSEIRIWSIADGSLKHKFDDAHSDAIFGLDFSPDGRKLASAAADRFARVFDLEKNSLVKSFEGHTHHVLAVAWKRDSRLLATAGADNLIKTWDFVSGDRKQNIAGWSKEVTSLSFIGDTDQILATSGDGRVRIIKDAGADVRAWQVSPDFVTTSAASLDGSIIITGGQDGILRIWNGATGAAIATYPDK